MAFQRNPPARNPREGVLQFVKKDWLDGLVRAFAVFTAGRKPCCGAMKILLLWITCVQRRNYIKYRICVLCVDTRKSTCYLDHFCAWIFSAYVHRYSL